MKQIILLYVLFGFSWLSLSAQNIDSIRSVSAENYGSIIKEIEMNEQLYNSLSPREKKTYHRWKWYWKSRLDNSGDITKYLRAMINQSNKTNGITKAALNTNPPSEQWESIGPNTRPLGSGNQIGRGRFVSLWVENGNPDHILAGSNNSGLWRTSNRGVSWENCTDGYEIGGIGGIAVDPDSIQIIYVVSRIGANGYFSKTIGDYSLGIFKSINGGDSWTKLNTSSIPLDYSLRDILLDSDNDILYVLARDDIYKSTDGGNTWNPTHIPINYSDSCYLNEMVFGQNSNSFCVSGFNALFTTSNINIPRSWRDNIDELSPIYTNSLISVTSYGDTLYCLYSDKKENSFIDKVAYSSDNGSSWYHTIYNANLDARHFITKIWAATDGDLYGGGVDIHRSIDQGNVWGSELNSNNIHDDVRACYFIESHPNYIFAAHDGGISYSDSDGQDWQNITGNIAATEFYGIDIIEEYNEYMIGGAHDCGTYIRNSDGIWTHEHSGDGGTSLLDHQDTAKYYYTIAGSGPVRFYNKTNGFLHNLIDINSPVIMHPANSNVLIRAGIKHKPVKYYLLRSSNRGVSYDTIYNIPNNLISLSYCKNEPDVFFFTTYNNWPSGESRIYKTSDSGNSFSQTDTTGIGYAIDNFPITCIYVNPYNSANVWITFGSIEANQQVFSSIDGGESWINKSGTGLPGLPIQCVEYDFLNGNIFVGTDLGLYYCAIDDLVWSKMNSFPDAMVTSLKINNKTGELIAGTYGRGAYRLQLGGAYCELGNPVNLSASQNYNTDQIICSDINVSNQSILTISAEITMNFHSTINVTDGSTLRIDSGQLINANIIIESGCKLEIINNGLITFNYDDELYLHSDATLNIVSGRLENRKIY